MIEFKVLREHWAEKDGKRHRFQKDEIRRVDRVTGEIESQLRTKILEPVGVFDVEATIETTDDAPKTDLPADPPVAKGRKGDGQD